MISQRKITEAIGSLSTLRGFPTKTEALTVIGRIIGESCADDAAVDAMVKRVLDSGDSWPGPASFKAAAPRHRDTLPEACDRCREYDFVYLEGNSGKMGRCDCPRGRALLDLDHAADRHYWKPPES